MGPPPQEFSNPTGLAASDDRGLTWRAIKEAVLPPGKNQPVMTPLHGEFDSKNQSYPMLIDMGSQLWTFYVGNEFGSTGIGLATLTKSELKR
jgi:hypothetical protein